MTPFDIFNLAVNIIVFLLTGWVVVNLVLHRKSWFLVIFFFVFTEASLLTVFNLLVGLPEWIWMLRVINSLVFIGAFVGLIYEAQADKFDSPADN